MRQPYERRDVGVPTVILERCELNLDVRALKEGLGGPSMQIFFGSSPCHVHSPNTIVWPPLLPRGHGQVKGVTVPGAWL
jgi:hypothetical protein